MGKIWDFKKKISFSIFWRLKQIFKCSTLVLFKANLTQFGADYDIAVQVSGRLSS